MAATEQVTLNVDGMTCAGCQAHVQEALAGKAGVTQASVNLLMKRAAVTFDPSVISPGALVEAVRESGYEASLPDSGADAIAEQEARTAPRRPSTAPCASRRSRAAPPRC